VHDSRLTRRSNPCDSCSVWSCSSCSFSIVFTLNCNALPSLAFSNARDDTRYTYTDPRGNSAPDVNRTIFVVDTTAPIVTCPDGDLLSDDNVVSTVVFDPDFDGTIVLHTDAGVAFAQRDFGVGVLTNAGFDVDDGSAYTVTLKYYTPANSPNGDVFADTVSFPWIYDGELLQSGEIEIQVTDIYGNAASPCRLAVVVVDTEPPAITCPSRTDVSNDANADGVINSYSHPAPTSGEPTVYALQTDVNQNFASATIAIPDITDNSESAGATVTYEVHRWNDDGGTPTFSGGSIAWPAEYTFAWLGSVTGTTAVAVSDSDSDGLPDAVGTGATAPRTAQLRFTATDVSGNSNTCYTDVVVVDLQDPEVACPASVGLTIDSSIVNDEANYVGDASTAPVDHTNRYVHPVNEDNYNSALIYETDQDKSYATAVVPDEASATDNAGAITVKA
jgi:hypothetical protein